MAKLLDKNLKQPALAIEVFDKIVELYPHTDSSHTALLEQARIQKNRLKNHKEAVDALMRLVNMFPGERAIAAYRQAADTVAATKDYARQAQLLEQLVHDYPEDKRSDQALWEAGQLHEKRLEDLVAAKQDYDKLVSDYPQSRLVKKAKKQIMVFDK